MSQCVPNWDLDDGLPNRSTATATTGNIHAPMSDYVVSELTWEKIRPSKDGGFHGSPPRRVSKLPQKRAAAGGGDPSWEKHHASGTLEAVVDQATRALIPAAVDALVPSNKHHDQVEHLPPARIVPDVAGVGAAAASGSACGGRKRARPGAAPGDGYCRSATGSAASAGLAFDSCDVNGDGGEETGFATSTSPLDGSPETEHASCGRALTAVSEEDDSYYSRRLSQKYLSDDEEKNEKERSTTMPTKRIRVAAVHNQSERKRRDRINQRMRTLQKLVPNSSKTDKASILDEVIDYMRQLQAQVQMMNRMNSIPPMMMPMAMQQMQMAVMAQMAQMAQMGMAMGMGMPDMAQPAGMPWAAAFHGGRDPTTAGAGAPFPQDPFAAFMAFQTQQQMAMDAHSRMAALRQQPHQQPPPGSTNENQKGGNVS